MSRSQQGRDQHFDFDYRGRIRIVTMDNPPLKAVTP
jgi:hypothetical protein